MALWFDTTHTRLKIWDAVEVLDVCVCTYSLDSPGQPRVVGGSPTAHWLINDPGVKTEFRLCGEFMDHNKKRDMISARLSTGCTENTIAFTNSAH